MIIGGLSYPSTNHGILSTSGMQNVRNDKMINKWIVQIGCSIAIINTKGKGIDYINPLYRSGVGIKLYPFKQICIPLERV